VATSAEQEPEREAEQEPEREPEAALTPEILLGRHAASAVERTGRRPRLEIEHVHERRV
jgi:hypothetical protein